MPWRQSLRSRFPIAFAVASSGGAIAGLLHEGGSALGSAGLHTVLAIAFAGGALGGFCSGRTLRQRRWLMIPFSVLASLMVPLTSLYVGLRGGVIVIELALPMALAFPPFALVYAHIVMRLSESSACRFVPR